MNRTTEALLTLFLLSASANVLLYQKLVARETLQVSALNDMEYLIEYTENGGEVLRLLDKDLDGRIDMMYQRIRDAQGKDLRDVLDYDLDGQADLKLEFDEGIGYVWHEGQWRNFEFDNGHWYITIDNTRVELTEDNSLMVKWHRNVYGDENASD